MNNDEKILSMLDLIANQVKHLSENMLTKAEFQAFREEEFKPFRAEFDTFREEEFKPFRAEFDTFREEEFKPFRAEFDTFREEEFKPLKDGFQTFSEVAETTLTEIDNKINKQNDLVEAQLDALNERVFKQEGRIKVLEKRIAL